MAAVARRSFLGLAGGGALALVARPMLGAGTAQATGEYGGSLPIVGLGTGEAASVSVTWVPLIRDQTPRSARLVILDLDGHTLASKSVNLAPFHGATVHWALPIGASRREVIGYVFIGQIDDVHAALEVYTVASGRTTKVIYDSIG